MKWTNRGHQLDSIGKKIAETETIYIWGAGTYGLECLNFLKWLDEFKILHIVAVDSDPAKQGCKIEDKQIISPKQMLEEYDACRSAIVITPYNSIDIVDVLKGKGISNYYFWNSHYNSNRNFIQNFVNIWLYYKHGKLMHHWGDYIVTNRCNLNCHGCLNFTSSITEYWAETVESFKEHIDILFSKYDYLFSFHFSGGEPTLNKDLAGMIEYICGKYKSRIFKELFFITNGTVRFSQELIDAVKANNVVVYIDDYRDNVPLAQSRFPELIETLKKYGVEYKVTYTKNWFDVDIHNADYSALQEEALIRHRDECNTMYQTFNNGNIYSCCYGEYAKNSNAIPADDSNVLSIVQTPKVELLEFGMGYTTTGYIELCKHCNGLGSDSKIIPCGVQIGGER